MLSHEIIVSEHTKYEIEKSSQSKPLTLADINILAIINYFQPSATLNRIEEKLQSIKSINKCLNHLKDLEFIIEEDNLIKLTTQFYDYFQIKSSNHHLVKFLLEKPVF